MGAVELLLEVYHLQISHGTEETELPRLSLADFSKDQAHMDFLVELRKLLGTINRVHMQYVRTTRR